MVLSTHQLTEERLDPQHNLSNPQSPPTPRLTQLRSNSRSARFPARIPRLVRRPQTIVYRDEEGNLLERPSSISSAISMTRSSNAYYIRSTSEDMSSVYDLHCMADEKAVDLASVCEIEIDEVPTNRNYVPLEFEIVSADGGQYSSIYNVHNMLKNDGTVYCSEKCGTINILLRFRGWTGNRNKCCVLSHIVIKSPTNGYTAPCKEGMIFVSHKPIDIQSTRAFDCFTKENYDRYTSSNRDSLDSSDPIAWFTATEQRLSIIDMKEHSCRYVLIKLLRADLESSENMDLQYVGFVGYFGSRCFAKARLH